MKLERPRTFRSDLIERLRAHARIESLEHAQDLRIAANEISYFDKFQNDELEEFFARLKHDLKDCMIEFFDRESGQEPYTSMSRRAEKGDSLIISFKSPVMEVYLRVEARRLKDRTHGDDGN